MRAFRSSRNVSQSRTASARSVSSVARSSSTPYTCTNKTSRAAAPIRRRGVSRAIAPTAPTMVARGRSPATSDKSSEDVTTQELRGFETTSIADRQEIGIDKERGREVGLVAFEGPEATPYVDVALGIGAEVETQRDIGHERRGV